MDWLTAWERECDLSALRWAAVMDRLTAREQRWYDSGEWLGDIPDPEEVIVKS